MEGRTSNNERPIARPPFPLPAVFQPSKRSELPTERKGKAGDRPPEERAHFYRKQTTETGTPVYDFFITSERENPGTKRQEDIS